MEELLNKEKNELEYKDYYQFNLIPYINQNILIISYIIFFFFNDSLNKNRKYIKKTIHKLNSFIKILFIFISTPSKAKFISFTYF